MSSRHSVPPPWMVRSRGGAGRPEQGPVAETTGARSEGPQTSGGADRSRAEPQEATDHGRLCGRMRPQVAAELALCATTVSGSRAVGRRLRSVLQHEAARPWHGLSISRSIIEAASRQPERRAQRGRREASSPSGSRSAPCAGSSSRSERILEELSRPRPIGRDDRPSEGPAPATGRRCPCCRTGAGCPAPCRRSTRSRCRPRPGRKGCWARRSGR